VDGELEGRHGIWNAAVVEEEEDDEAVVEDVGDADGGFEEWLLLT